ncbi:hypothetical protein Nepgr_001260 [Nepenthes gracilis]|uniref:ubiquitinyl hydrolase 1 n=1 Tax=Nepenthes gracilis TaxID=150966 RepID=A0AAD3RXA3_NEPGR|nr:hypothetical protein Nepgr_001260 [Nepenthes gracilis]
MSLTESKIPGNLNSDWYITQGCNPHMGAGGAIPNSRHSKSDRLREPKTCKISDVSISSLFDQINNYSKRLKRALVEDILFLQTMISCEMDPDVVRWGLNLLCVHPTGYWEKVSANVENDEIIAHALQEELSRVAASEASGSSDEGEKQLQGSILAQDWVSPSKRETTFEHTSSQEEADDIGTCTPSGPLNILLHGDACLLPPEMTEESALDGEVGKRLNHMVSIPHFPRVNREIPSDHDAESDHQRLLDRLKVYELVELKVKGDGNCQFRSLSDQIYRNVEHHGFVRQQVLDQLKSHPEIYEAYVPMPYGDYLKKMSKSGEWGDHVTLQAAADRYGVKIFVLTSFKDTCYIEILPRNQKSDRVIFLSFWAEVHYNSIYPEGELLVADTKKKKRRFFGLYQKCRLC